MSSSPRTEPAARWRRPATWSLRARIVAIIIVLLTVLGIVVGGTAEIFLRNQLYDQIDARLGQALHPPAPRGGFDPNRGPSNGGSGNKGLFIGAEPGSIAISYTDATDVTGGYFQTMTSDEGYGLEPVALNATALAQLLKITP